MLTLCELPLEERPRERLKANGAPALADEELLAIILGSGGKGRDALKVARDLLPIIDAEWPLPSHKKLQAIKGIGPTKAALIVAGLEFARRRIRPSGVVIREAKDVIPLVQHLSDRRQEHFICVSLNGAHEVIAVRVVTIGLVNSTQVHPREVFADVVTDRGVAVIVAHNHPSGVLTPSEEDRRVTKSLKVAGEVLGIKLLDHIIFGSGGFYSFAERGEM